MANNFMYISLSPKKQYNGPALTKNEYFLIECRKNKHISYNVKFYCFHYVQ